MNKQRGDWKAISGLVHPYERNARRERDEGLRAIYRAGGEHPRTRIKYTLHGYQVQIYVPRPVKEQQP